MITNEFDFKIIESFLRETREPNLRFIMNVIKKYPDTISYMHVESVISSIKDDFKSNKMRKFTFFRSYFSRSAITDLGLSEALYIYTIYINKPKLLSEHQILYLERYKLINNCFISFI